MALLASGKPDALFAFTHPEASAIEHQWDRRYYLATFPRSGNHWIRYLIEEATGIATSSVYQDPDPMHLSLIFPWGGYCCAGGYEGMARYPTRDESVMIKTHFPALDSSPFDQLPARKIIRIVRNPLDSIYSFYVYIKGEDLKGVIPQRYLVWAVDKWKKFQSYWDQEENVVTLSYESFLENPLQCLSLVLSTAGYTFTEEDVKRALQKYPPRGNPNKHIHHYTQEQVDYVYSELAPLMRQHGYGFDGVP